jgi:UDP-3-O-[3-hydroxymyristoyl] N-acetylglucosamine deacetylase
MYTLAKSLELSGVGLHSGEEALVRLSPRAKAGIEIWVNGQPLTLSPHNMRPTPLRTTLHAGEVELATPEHLFAALHGLSILGVKVEIEGHPEVPILDGSALPWVAAIDAAGRTELVTPPTPLKVYKPCTYSAEGRVLLAMPRPLGGLEVECTVDFPSRVIGRQHWHGVMTEDVFRTEIAPARSFAMQADVEAAMAAGLLKGASLASGVLLTREETIANPEGLRFPDEPVRHKVLDFIGDSFLAGRPVQGSFSLTAPGHTANIRLLQQVYAQAEAA